MCIELFVFCLVVSATWCTRDTFVLRVHNSDRTNRVTLQIDCAPALHNCLSALPLVALPLVQDSARNTEWLRIQATQSIKTVIFETAAQTAMFETAATKSPEMLSSNIDSADFVDHFVGNSIGTFRWYTS